MFLFLVILILFLISYIISLKSKAVNSTTNNSDSNAVMRVAERISTLPFSTPITLQLLLYNYTLLSVAEKEDKHFNEQASPERIDQNNDKVIIMPSAIINSGSSNSSAQQQQTQQSSHQGSEDLNQECGIRDVWRHNLEDEFVLIRKIVNKYCYVAMDTEFPGVVARPIGEFRSTADYQYQLLRCNVDLLKIIQLGLTFMDEDGNTAPDFSTWQFNFKFSLTEDMYAQDSIDLLQNSGIQFKKHEEEGIDPIDFAELLMTSGIVLMDNIKWLSFHSGYDFGYLLKVLTDQNLPSDESEFFELLRIYFPTIYDVKYLMKSCKNLKGGLQEVAEQLDIRRIGPQHQAGSDSLLTGMAFFKMREMFFEDNIDNDKYSGHLFGLSFNQADRIMPTE